MRARFQALLIGLVLSSAAAIAFVVWGPGSEPVRTLAGLPTPAQRAKLTTLAGRVAADNHAPNATATVVSTTEPALFRFNHGSGGNSGKDIYLVVLRGNFETRITSPNGRPLIATGNEIVLEYAAHDLAYMGFEIGSSRPGLMKLGPSRRLIPSD